jgi:hypothetical protein
MYTTQLLTPTFLMVLVFPSDKADQQDTNLNINFSEVF